MVFPHVLSDIMDNISASEWQIVQLREGLRVLLRDEEREVQEEALRQALQQASGLSGSKCSSYLD